MDAWDLLDAVGLGDCEGDLFEDLCEAFSDHNWVHVDPYGDLLCDSLHYTWGAFANQVKHRTRFVFFRVPNPDKQDWEQEPHGILESLGKITKEVELVRAVPEGTSFFRAHQHSAEEQLTGAKRLGAPLPEVASHNRMSPAGIPMLYVCTDQQTALTETLRTDPNRPMMTVASFANLRNLRVLDLSIIPDVPSVFDEDRRHLRMYLIFMHRFAHEISLPISDAAKSYEYVPTQVLTEYFRHVFKERNGKPIDGIAYRSSRNQGGICYTLFFDQEHFVDSAEEKKGVMLLQGAEVSTVGS
jgi:hypothetical protein